MSEIIYPAVSREIVDWDTLNSLYEANSDFQSFIEDVLTSVNAKKKYGKYDDIFDDEEQARQYAKEKGMIK